RTPPVAAPAPRDPRSAAHSSGAVPGRSRLPGLPRPVLPDRGPGRRTGAVEAAGSAGRPTRSAPQPELFQFFAPTLGGPSGHSEAPTRLRLVGPQTRRSAGARG